MLNKFSQQVTQDPTQPAAQAMLHALGLTDEDLQKPLIGIASTGYEGNPCNMHLNDLSVHVKKGTEEAGLIGLIFNTIGVSDGISMGTPGMRFSLPSRDVIADSVETVVQAMCYDGVITVVGCDKNMPGALMGMLRLNRPGILVYGGTIAAGCGTGGKKLDVVSAFEAWGEKVAGTITEKEFKNVIHNACPGAGACGGMYTANTMASAIEAMGMALPFNSSNPAVSNDKESECVEAGRKLRYLLENDIKPLDIVTKKSLENAFRLVTILGGSTNAVLHLLAIAKAAQIDFTLDDFQRISDNTPFIADLKPSGKYVMEDLHHVGGIPAVLKYMLKKGLLHGDCLTVTGKTLAEKIQNFPEVSLELINGDLYKHNGRIETVTGQVDPGTGTVSFRAVFPNPDRILSHGGSGSVLVPRTYEDVAVIPESATIDRQGRVFVYEVHGDTTAVSRSIRVTDRINNLIVVGEGLSAGDVIVARGSQNLRDYAPINVVMLPFDSIAGSVQPIFEQ